MKALSNTKRAAVRIDGDLPLELVEHFLQHIRDFDVAHEGCHFQIFFSSPDVSLEECQAIFRRIDPPFPYITSMLKQ
jgi:hypothetical protein